MVGSVVDVRFDGRLVDSDHCADWLGGVVWVACSGLSEVFCLGGLTDAPTATSLYLVQALLGLLSLIQFSHRESGTPVFASMRCHANKQSSAVRDVNDYSFR